MPEEQPQQEKEVPYKKYLFLGVGVVVLALAIGLPLGLLLGNSDNESTNLEAATTPNASPTRSPTSSSSGGSGSSSSGSFPTLRPVSAPFNNIAPINRNPIQCLPDNYSVTALTSGICSGGLRREELFLRTLRQVSANSLLTNPSRPQGKAYAFLVNYDPMFQGSCSTTGLKERYILMVLFFATKGEYWSSPVGWCGGSTHCNWSGISCNQFGAVQAIDLESSNLSGTIPDEIFGLLQLERLNLFANSLFGTIPNLSTIYNLKEIDLQNNLLSGDAIPRTLPTSLISYKVSGNELAGTIPGTTIEKFTKLETLWAGQNQISGTIPTNFGRMNRLKSLYLYENSLQGSLPSQLGNILLEEIWLSNNFFEVELPQSIFFLGSLKLLRLENNVFSSTLPTWIGLLTNLQDFRVNNNNLDGTVPVQLNQLVNLKDLHLGNNFWIGNLPNIFGNLRQLETFDISNTDVGGVIPTTLFQVPTIDSINLSYTRLSGSLPTSFASANSLRRLYLNDMPALRGNLPAPGSGQLTSLTEVLVQRSGLSGSMPTEICNLRYNYYLDTLEADCLGSSPSLECDYPDCCTECF